MAQNDYGLKMISMTCYLFALSFAVELFWTRGRSTFLQKTELFILIVFFLLFGLRAAYIHFPYVEWIVVGSALVLAITSALFGIHNFRELRETNSETSRIVASYYLSLVFFLCSVLLRPLSAQVSQGFGGVGGLFLGLFVLGAIFRRKQIIAGIETTVMEYVRSRGDHTSMLMTGFLLISIYVGLNFLGFLPTLYTSEVPKVYIELVNQAETGKEVAVDGKFQHDQYKEELDKFLDRHGLDAENK